MVVWLIVLAVCAVVISWATYSAVSSDIRDRRTAQEKEERDRASGALPYNYVPRTNKREMK